MNLALGAILLAILLTPPLVLMYFFSRGAHARGMPKLTLLEYFLLSSTFSLLMHGTAILFIQYTKGDISRGLGFLFQILSGKYEDKLPGDAAIAEYMTNFGVYIFCISSVSAVVGLLLRELLTGKWLRTKLWLQRRRKNLPPTSGNLYYSNWWYFFRANEYDSEYAYAKSPLVNIDVLVDTKDATVLYSGILMDFRLKGDDLDFVYMKTIRKRAFSEPDAYDPSKLKEGREIPVLPRDGLMAIPYSKIINFFIRFAAPPPNPSRVKEGFHQRARPVIVTSSKNSNNKTAGDSNKEKVSEEQQSARWMFIRRYWIKITSFKRRRKRE